MSFQLMTSRTFSALKGWPSPSAVDFSAVLDATITAEVPPGTVLHVTTTGTFALGVGNTPVMPMFSVGGSEDPDVVNSGGGDPSTDKGAWIGITPGSGDPTDTSGRGKMTALVCVGAYELVSTNYLDGQSYTPNVMLTAAVGTDPTTAGVLKPGTLKTDTIVGLVSRGEVDNGYGTTALAFWPWFMPHFT